MEKSSPDIKISLLIISEKAPTAVSQSPSKTFKTSLSALTFKLVSW